jgi:hypothetical protein
VRRVAKRAASALEDAGRGVGTTMSPRVTGRAGGQHGEEGDLIELVDGLDLGESMSASRPVTAGSGGGENGVRGGVGSGWNGIGGDGVRGRRAGRARDKDS